MIYLETLVASIETIVVFAMVVAFWAAILQIPAFFIMSML